MMRASTLALLAATATILTTPAHAQTRLVGLTAGATLSGFGSVSSSQRWGFTGGLTAGIRNWNWSITSLEVTFTQRGASGTRLDYIDVPLMFGGSSRIGQSSARWRFYGGIMAGFKIGCSSSTSGSTACSNARGTTWGLPFGVQIGSYRTGKAFVALDIRYTVGLNDAFTTSPAFNRGWTFKVILGQQR